MFWRYVPLTDVLMIDDEISDRVIFRKYDLVFRQGGGSRDRVLTVWVLT